MTAPVASPWRERVADMLQRLETMQPPNVLLQQITMLGEAAGLLREALASPAGEGADLDAAAVEAGHITWRSMQQCADAWLAVNNLLHELAPDWTNNSLTGREAALAAIRRLATPEQPGSAVQSEDGVDTINAATLSDAADDPALGLPEARAMLRDASGLIRRLATAAGGAQGEAVINAARDVCAYDWSDNDDDAVEAVERLRQAITTPPPAPAAERLARCHDCHEPTGGQHICLECAELRAESVADAVRSSRPEARGVGMQAYIEKLEHRVRGVRSSEYGKGKQDGIMECIEDARAMLAAAPAAPGAVGVDEATATLERLRWGLIPLEGGGWDVTEYPAPHFGERVIASAATPLAALAAALAGKDGAR